jgi:sensor histidine kinase regulating citrate/malate metabolism
METIYLDYLSIICLVIVILLLLVYNIYTTYTNRKYEKELIDKIVNPAPIVFQPIQGGVTQSESDEPPLTVEEMLKQLEKDKEQGVTPY